MGDDLHCPSCGEHVESRGQFDQYQNTRLRPCGCIVAAADIQEALS